MISRYGRYEVLYKLGQGAMAQVFLARDPVLSRFVAVKVLHAELAARKDVLQRFFNEARTVAAVRNPHVVEVFDFGQEGRDLYLVMEFVDGLSLHGILRQLPGRDPAAGREPRAGHASGVAPTSAPLDIAITASLICHAAEGLSVAAQHGVVHRDIKPENLMINQQGYLKISDFGIAHVQDESITKTGAVLGSPLYMSPEQARGLKPITSQADMFSLGAVFYSCLTGHPPFRGRTVTELFRKIASEAHTPVRRIRPDLDPALGNLVDTLLHKDPSQRGGGPRWLHRQLKGYLMALGVVDPAETIAAYLQGISALGVQTTWRMDSPDPWRADTLPAGTLPLGSGYPGDPRAGAADPGRVLGAGADAMTAAGGGGSGATLPLASGFAGEPGVGMPRAALGAVLLVLVLALAAGAGWWGFRHMMKGPPRDARAHLEIGSRTRGNLPGTWETGAAIGTDSAAREPAGGERIGAAEADSSQQGFVHSADPYFPDSATGKSPTPGEGLGLVTLKSSPPFAEAFLDGHYLGVTPVHLGGLFPGRHRITLKAKHSPALDTVLMIRPGTQGFKFNLEAGLPSRLAVTPEATP